MPPFKELVQRRRRQQQGENGIHVEKEEAAICDNVSRPATERQTRRPPTRHPLGSIPIPNSSNNPHHTKPTPFTTSRIPLPASRTPTDTFIPATSTAYAPSSLPSSSGGASSSALPPATDPVFINQLWKSVRQLSTRNSTLHNGDPGHLLDFASFHPPSSLDKASAVVVMAQPSLANDRPTTPAWLRQRRVQFPMATKAYTIKEVFGNVTTTPPPPPPPPPGAYYPRQITANEACFFMSAYAKLRKNPAISRAYYIYTIMKFLDPDPTTLAHAVSKEGKAMAHQNKNAVHVGWRIDHAILPISQDSARTSVADNEWRAPPLIFRPDNNGETQSGSTDHSLLIPAEYCRPKATFWLDLSRCTVDYQSQTSTVAVLTGAYTTPFLTVEFETDEDVRQGIREAYLYRMALAGAVILYNSFRLRLQALSGEDPKTPEQAALTKSLVHFGMTFDRHKYQVWKMEPIVVLARAATSGPLSTAPLSAASRNSSKTQHSGSRPTAKPYPSGFLAQQATAAAAAAGPPSELGRDSWQWRGCTVTKLTSGDCEGDCHAVRLLRWFQAITDWGATAWADAVEGDIKAVHGNVGNEDGEDDVIGEGVEDGQGHQASE